jgi:hypothetical protein
MKRGCSGNGRSSSSANYSESGIPKSPRHSSLGSDVGRDHPVYRAATRSLAKLEATDGPLVEDTAPAPPAGSG